MSARPRAVALALLVALTGFGAACGNGTTDDTEPPATSRPAAPTDDSDLSSAGFVGLTEEEAGARAERQGRAWRVVHRDGEDLPVTADYQAFRLNFTVVDGVVTASATDAEIVRE